jgi:hypothetical protein
MACQPRTSNGGKDLCLPCGMIILGEFVGDENAHQWIHGGKESGGVG